MARKVAIAKGGSSRSPLKGGVMAKVNSPTNVKPIMQKGNVTAVKNEGGTKMRSGVISQTGKKGTFKKK